MSPLCAKLDVGYYRELGGGRVMSGCAPIGSTTGHYDLANQNQPPSPVRCVFAALEIFVFHFKLAEGWVSGAWGLRDLLHCHYLEHQTQGFRCSPQQSSSKSKHLKYVCI